MNKEKNTKALITTTLVGLVCGLVLTQQHVKAATEDSANNQSSTAIVQTQKENGTNVFPIETSAYDNSGTNVDPNTKNNPEDTNNKESDSFDDIKAANKQTNSATSSEVMDQGTWGTSKWEYKHEGNDYVLYLHEGVLGVPEYANYAYEGIKQLNSTFTDQLTKIKIDPGVVANKDSRGLFYFLNALTAIDGLENLDTSKVTTMEDMFSGCFSLTNLDLSHFDTSNVTNMANMFSFCANISDLCLSNFNTSRVTDMEYMFEDCDNLSSVDLSSFDTNNVAKFDQMFQLCIKLNHLVLGTKSLFSQYAEMGLPEVPSVGTLVPGTDKKVTAPYWVSTSGYEQGKQYTSEELMAIKNRDQVTTYDWVSAAPVAEVSTESKAVSRLINIHQPDNTTKTITQTAMIKRQVNTNEDGSIDYGAWSTASWDAYDLPVFAGYSASSKQIPAAVVDGQTQDQVVDIFYEPVEQTITVQYLDKGKVVGIQQLTGYVGETITPNYHVPAGYELAASPQPTVKVDASGKQVIKVNVNHKLVQSTEIRTFTRTINVHQPDGTIKTTNQVAVVRRTVTIDQATGMRTTGSWHTDIWEEYRLPEITGYTPTKSVIPIKVIDANSQNERIDVYYKANK